MFNHDKVNTYISREFLKQRRDDKLKFLITYFKHYDKENRNIIRSIFNVETTMKFEVKF